MDVDLRSKIAVISGAGRGIGKAIAKAYAGAGARVFLLARSETELAVVCNEIAADGGEAIACPCDVADSTALSNAMAAISARDAGIDLMVINAGINGTRSPVADSDPADWARVINVNVTAAYNQARLAIPLLRARGGGKIIFMGSGMGRRPAPGGSAYAVSKAGLAMLNRALAVELRHDNIAVNEIVPGPVMTAMTGVYGEANASPEELATIRERFPKTEWLKTPEDVTPLALYLAGLSNHGPSGQTFSLMGRDM